MAVFFIGAGLLSSPFAQSAENTNATQGWDVITNSDFGPASAHPLIEDRDMPRPGYVVGGAGRNASELTPVTEAASTEYPELAAQYLESARWNERRGEYDQMVSNLRSASNYASAGAHYELAKIYLEGTHLKRDIDQTQLHLNAAAGLGNAEAQRVLGRMLLSGEFGPPNINEGVERMTLAAQTSTRAKRELGMWYAGLVDGVAKDINTGAQLLREAAELGDSDAAEQLAKVAGLPAEMYEVNVVDETPIHSDSTTVSHSPPTAQQLFDRANAIMLRPQNQRNLQNEAMAYALFKLSFEKGNEMAGRELNYLDGIKVLMDRKDPQWLDDYKEKAIWDFVKN